MTYVPTKEIKIKERQDKFLKAQLEKEREQALLEEIEKTEKERVKKKGRYTGAVFSQSDRQLLRQTTDIL